MWDQRYSEAGFSYGKKPNDFVVSEYTKIPSHGNVLCLAEGEGRNAVYLAEKGYSVTAVDISPVGLKKAEQLARDRNVQITTIVSDLSTFNFGEQRWDGIVSIFAHIPREKRKLVHAKVKSALKPNGVFILEAYTIKQLQSEGIGGPPPTSRDFFMSSHELENELSGVDIQLNIEKCRILQEGKYHRGPSEVVQFVAFKY